jgi:hypothetical protein
MMKKYLLALFIMVAILLSLYWFKCRIGINLFDLFSLSDSVPFCYFKKNEIIAIPEPGMLLNLSFDSYNFIEKWYVLWMREKGKVTITYDSKGINNSRCLLITSKSCKSWSCSHNKLIEVQKGDVFGFEGFVSLKGKNLSAYIGVSSFDEDKKVIQWSYLGETTSATVIWVKLAKHFTIPEGISYIDFKLSGAGTGEFRFDNILFWKEPSTIK